MAVSSVVNYGKYVETFYVIRKLGSLIVHCYPKKTSIGIILDFFSLRALNLKRGSF